MIYRLQNQKYPDKTLSLTANTWHKILDLAEKFGWSPVVRGQSDHWEALLPVAGTINGRPLLVYDEAQESKLTLIIIEDALNLADCLEDAFIDLEPVRLPSRYFYFKDWGIENDLAPSIGAIQSVIDFARIGAFHIEAYRRLNQSDSRGFAG